MIPAFPRDRRLCTSLPIKIFIRRGAEQLMRLNIWDTVTDSEVGTSRIIPFKSGERHVSEAMREALDVAKDEKVSETREIRLHITSPDLPPMNLLDLPGLVQAPAELKKRTHALVDKALAENRDNGAVFLAVMNAEGPTNCGVMQHIFDNKVDGRTIGVVTHCDKLADYTHLIDEREKELVRGWLWNRPGADDAVPLTPHGYVATMNAPPIESKEGSARLLAQAQREIEFFEENGFEDELKAGRRTR